MSDTYSEVNVGPPNTPEDVERFRQDAVDYFVRVGDITLAQADWVVVTSSDEGDLLSAVVESWRSG